MLVVPVPYASVWQPLRWHAQTGYPGSMTGGYFIGPGRTGQAVTYGGHRTRAIDRSIDALWVPASRYKPPTVAQMRGYVARWKPAAVVAVTQRRSRLGRLLAAVLGPPSFTADRVVVWRR